MDSELYSSNIIEDRPSTKLHSAENQVEHDRTSTAIAFLEFDQQPEKGWGLSASPRTLVNYCALFVYYGGRLMVAVENRRLTLLLVNR